MPTAYAQDGVDVHEGDSFSQLAGKVCQSTYHNSPYVQVHDYSRGHFRGPRTFSLRGLPEGCTLSGAPDGIGTKVIVYDAARSHRRAARCLIAMTAGDISRDGGLPLVFFNVLDAKTLGKSGEGASERERQTNQAFREVIVGLGEVCSEEGYVALKGETAELGVCVSSENPGGLAQFNWAGFMLGVFHERLLITGENLKPGQLAMVLREYGLRSNGISTARAALRIRYGERWYDEPEAESHVKAAALPSVLYDRFLCYLNGWEGGDLTPVVPVHLIVHVTGGALKGKLFEDQLKPRGLGAELTGLWEPPEIMRLCAEWRGLLGKDEELYETWNGGQGVLAVIDEKDHDRFVAEAHEFGLEAKAAGPITAKPKLTVASKYPEGRQFDYA